MAWVEWAWIKTCKVLQELDINFDTRVSELVAVKYACAVVLQDLEMCKHPRTCYGYSCNA